MLLEAWLVAQMGSLLAAAACRRSTPQNEQHVAQHLAVCMAEQLQIHATDLAC